MPLPQQCCASLKSLNMINDFIIEIPDCLTAMIAALDKRDVAQIEHQTARLAELLHEYGQSRPEPAHIDTRHQIDHALKQAVAASIRVNYHADWTRQRIDRLTQIRSGV